MDLEAAQAIEGRSGFDRWLAVLVGIAALLAALAATFQAHAGHAEESANTGAAILSVDIFEKIVGSSLPTSFVGRTARETLRLQIEATGRQATAIEHPSAAAFAEALAAADLLASDRLSEVTRQMAESILAPTGLDPIAQAALETGLEALQAQSVEQGRLVDLATSRGNRGNRAVFGLTLAALAAVLLGLAGVVGESRAGVMVLVAAGAAATLSAGWTLTAVPL